MPLLGIGRSPRARARSYLKETTKGAASERWRGVVEAQRPGHVKEFFLCLARARVDHSERQGGAVDQHSLARGETGTLDQPLPTRQSGNRCGGCMNVIDASRLVGDIGDARHAVFGGCAVPVPVIESVY
jgi:hypothetical protein